MNHAYHPTVREAVYPSDGGWTRDKQSDVLLLQITEYKAIIGKSFHSFDYAWLYDSKLRAYLFCFKLSNGEEKAVIFQEEHAGLLLMDALSYETFSIAITDQPIESINDQTELLILPGIELQRSQIAGW